MTEKRMSLAQKLVIELSRRIRAGELPAGTKLPTEQALTEECGVSRTVVREAMSRLQAEGLVETRRGIGTFVMEAIEANDAEGSKQQGGGPHDPVAVIELRLSLEIEAAAIAAQRATPDQLLAMRIALDEAQGVEAGDPGAARRDFEFNLQIARCTGNGFFVDAMTHLGNSLLSNLPVEQLAPHVREREQIFAAIGLGDADLARAAMRLHLNNGLQRARAEQARSEPSA